MITFINWLAFHVATNHPIYKFNYWLRYEVKESYIYRRTICWCADLLITVFVILEIIQSYFV